MKFDFKKIRKIWRIELGFKFNTSFNYKIYRYFQFPARPKSVVYFIKMMINSRSFNPEFGLVKCLSRVVQPNDKLLGAGLGYGVTAIHNLNLKVLTATYIEPSITQIELAIQNIKLNHDDIQRLRIIHGVLGDPIDVYNSESSNNKVDLRNFDFDVLELDCQGSEIEILNEMVNLPRAIIVEFHPGLVEIDIEQLIFGPLNNYSVAFVCNVDGLEIEPSDLVGYLSRIKESVDNYSNPIVVFELKTAP